jgi:hypothetical protein
LQPLLGTQCCRLRQQLGAPGDAACPLTCTRAGDEWFEAYAAGVPDMPEEVKKFSGPRYLISLGYSLGKAVDIDLFWFPPGYEEHVAQAGAQ